MKKMIAVIVSTFVLSSSAFAAEAGMLKACKKEIKKFSCDATSEQTAHECLEKHEAHKKKNDGFSHGCYEAHEAFEKKMGTEEKGEHHDEATEQKSGDQKQ
jgi:hypothetical protein